MDKDELASRLQGLSLLLGKKVELNAAPSSPTSPDPFEEMPDMAELQAEYGVENTPWMQPSHEPEGPSSEEIRKARRDDLQARAYGPKSYVVGQPADKDLEFCPWKIATTYPSFFIGKTNRPRAKPFFDDIANERIWDLFYIYDPDETKEETEEETKEPRLLVPTAQFEAFLEEINDTLDTELTIPKGPNTASFTMKFSDEHTLRPRFLKRSFEESDMNISSFPAYCEADFADFSKAAPSVQHKVKRQLRLLKNGITVQTIQNQVKAAKKARERQEMLKQVLQFLGLLPDPIAQDVVFVAVDVEAYELSPKQITEIGWAILDTRDIRNIIPGPSGENWIGLAKAYHMRIWEVRELQNSRFVKGCPDKFNFGRSTFPKRADVGAKIKSMLEPYTRDNRNVIIVGHDVMNDIDYLARLGVNLRRIASVVGQTDTQDLHRAWKDDTNGRGLRTLLSDLEVEYRNLHNAGNDAWYTLHALVGIAVRAFCEEREVAVPEQKE